MKDYTDFNYLLEKQVGACRHRCYLFLALAQQLGITARIVTNDCHGFVEINCQGEWITQDLGGYPSNLNVKPLQAMLVDNLTRSKKEEASELKLARSAYTKKEAMISSQKSIFSPVLSFTEGMMKLDEKLATCALNQQQAMLIFPGTTDIESFYLYLRDEKDKHAQHVLYLSSFRDLSFKTIKVTQTDLGYEEIDSSFIRDLKQLKSGDVLLINFDRYQMTDVGYNTLFDTPRRLGDVPIPDGVAIIAAMDPVTSQQMGEDVLSRFPIKQLGQLALPECISRESEESFENNNTSLIIDLYDAVDWKERLTGQLQYTGQTGSPFIFNEGAFQQAFTENKNLEIRHAPINTDPHCKRFFSDLERYRTIESNGEKILLPESLTWQITHPAYEFASEITVESIRTGVAWDQILSPYTLDGLLHRYQYSNEAHTFSESPGLLADYSAKTLRLYVTQDLPEGQWARLCQQADAHNCQLHFILGENIRLPVRLAAVTKAISSTAGRTTMSSAFSAECYQSNDADLTLSQLKRSNDSAIIIHVDQNTSYADLVSPMQVNTSENKASLPSFHIQEGNY